MLIQVGLSSAQTSKKMFKFRPYYLDCKDLTFDLNDVIQHCEASLLSGLSRSDGTDLNLRSLHLLEIIIGISKHFTLLKVIVFVMAYKM